MITKYLQSNVFFRSIIYKIGRKRSLEMFDRIKKFLNKNNYILDIGSGTCNLYEILLQNHYKTVSLDVQNLSFVTNLQPMLFDGDKIPFDENKFDVALILTVLHHTPNPEKIIKEAMRVSKCIIIIEDIYDNKFHKYLTYFFDSLLNLEFIGHPHTNKDDRQWKKTFSNLGLKLIDVRYDKSFLFFKQATYYLAK